MLVCKMLVCLSLTVLLFSFAFCEETATQSSSSSSYPVGDVRNCPVRTPQDDSQPLYRMEVLPGIGFDNLRNMDMGQVHTYNFSTCKVSENGEFLLPDTIFVTPIQESKVEVFAEYFDHWDSYTSMTSQSINVDAGFFSIISGKFSTGYTRTKSHMVNDEAKSTRVQIRNKRYSVKLQPGAALHPVFKSRVFDIASSIQNNNTEYAHYLAELMVRDYGTHYVSSVEAGAILSQVDFITSSNTYDMSKYVSHITASASGSFFNHILDLGVSFQHSTSQTSVSEFWNNRTYSEVITVGGPPFTPNLTLTEWEKGVDKALVAIDRSGDPLHFVINPITLPKLPESTVRSVADIVQKAINRYYKVNTRPGCTDPAALNFNFNANLNDSTCKPPATNISFGGMYQECTVDPNHNTEDLCTPHIQKNPLTGTFTCPPKYTPVLLHSGVLTHVIPKQVCHTVCKHFLGIKHGCHPECANENFQSLATYDTYWCAALNGVHLEQNEGYLFGGFYTSKMSNPLTGAMTCPRFFYSLRMGEDVEVCVSSDYEQGYAYAVDFAGFESCSVGNPLADSTPNDQNQARWPHTCPHGYTQHLVAVEDGCEINFCVRFGSFKSKELAPPRRPPFRKHPKYKGNITDTLAVFGVNGEIWVKNDDGEWDEVEFGSENGRLFLERMNVKSSGEGLSGGVVAVLTIMSTVILGLIIALVVFVGRRSVRKRRAEAHGDYMSINDTADKGTNSMENPTSDSPGGTAEPV